MRGHVLPDVTKTSEFAFGKEVPVSESAKNLLYPEDHPEDVDPEVLAQYRRTHLDFAPGVHCRSFYGNSHSLHAYFD